MRALTELDPKTIGDLLEHDEFFWLDLEAPGEEQLATLAELFDLHPLALEDIRDADQRPKLDTYAETALLVFYGAAPGPDGDPELVEVSLIISGGYIVSVHHTPCAELSAVHEKVEQRAPDHSEAFVIYAVLDALTDSYFPVLEAIEDEVDELDTAIADRPDREQIKRISTLKRHLVGMRQKITPQRDLFARNADEILELPGLEHDSRDYFRDLYDHLIRIAEQIEGLRDVLTGSTDVYLAMVADRRDEVNKQLTVVATIFLPLTFLTGFFGQNFGWLVRHVGSEGDFLVFGVGGLVASVVALLWLFRARHWL